MENLWKKESTVTGVQYVDLFKKLENKKVLAFDMKYPFLSSPFRKNNEQSIELRNRGNEQFYLRNLHKAMDYYNQSLCFAELDSEDVALGFANRSACFFHMQKYREAIVDIELAKSAFPPEHMVAELDHRKQESQHLMAVDRLSDYLPKLSYEADENFDCVANVLELKHNNEFGRYFTAKCDIPVGKIVLTEQSFIGASKSNGSMSCSNCLQTGMNFIACQKCTAAVFCSIKCMEQNTTHKWECGSLFNSSDHEIRFQAQAVFLAIEAFSNVDHLMKFVQNVLLDPGKSPTSLHNAASKYHFFFTLSKSLPAADDIFLVYTIYTDLMSIHKIAALFDSQEKQRFLQHLVAHHFLVILNNSHGSKSYESVGNIFSMFNHSCAPNLLQYFSGKQHLMTIRPVKKGDQLFISYLGTQKQSVQDRQEKLKSNWNFICKCERCNPTDVAIDQKVITSDSHFQFIFKNGYMEEKSTEILNNCIEFLNKYGHSPWSEEIQFVINIYCAHLMRNNLTHSDDL